MTSPIPGAVVLKNWSLKMGSQEVGNQCMKAQLVPSSTVQSLKTAVPGGVVQDVDNAAWTLQLTGVENMTPSTGIGAILFNGEGSVISCEFVPHKVTGQPKFTFDIIATPLPIGGEAGQFNTGDVSLPIQGKPTQGTYSAT